jgi:hypothetical protein
VDREPGSPEDAIFRLFRRFPSWDRRLEAHSGVHLLSTPGGYPGINRAPKRLAGYGVPA